MSAGCLEIGDVALCQPYEHGDGSTSDAKFIVISGISAERHVLYFVCTSQEKHGKTKSPACQANHFNSSYVIEPPPKKKGKFKAKQRDGFSKLTWVDLVPEIELEEALRERFQSGRMQRRFALADHEFQGLVACFRVCPDCAPIHLSYLGLA